MVQARRQFLDTNWYQAISDLLNSTVSQTLDTSRTNNLLDAGCGEGYYLARLVEHCDKEINAYGLDISKFAVAAAAKKYKALNWLVASNRQIPLADSSLDSIICAFGFPCYQEFSEKLKPTGKLFLMETQEQHLIELRQLIYPELKAYKPLDLTPAENANFVLEDKQSLQQSITLDKQAISQLLAMTPHLYRAPKEGIAKVEALSTLTLTLDVALYQFGRC
nr:methyltransferase domain-containing protein [Marinifaba aquimaris]